MNETFGYTDELKSMADHDAIGAPQGTGLDAIIPQLDSHIDYPLRMFASFPTPDSKLNISSNQTEAGDGTKKTTPPIESVLNVYPATTIDFQSAATTGGTVKVGGGAFALPDGTLGQFRRVAFVYKSALNEIEAAFSVESATLGGLVNPAVVFPAGDVNIGYMDLECTDATVGDSKYKTAGSATAIIENKVGSDPRMFRVFGGGAGGGGLLQYEEKTVNTTMSVNKGFVSNSASPVIFTLPAVSVAFDRIDVAGKGTGGWAIHSNAAATTQKIVKGDLSSPDSSNDNIQLLTSSSQYDAVTLLCLVPNSLWAVIDSQGGEIGNWWGDGSDGDVSTAGGGAGDIIIPVVEDGDMVVKNFLNFSLNTGDTLTPQNRCKGTMLLVRGNMYCDGKISMTGKGYKGDPTGVDAGGLVIRRAKVGGGQSHILPDQLAGCGAVAQASENKQKEVDDGIVYYVRKYGGAGAPEQSDSVRDGIGYNAPGQAGNAFSPPSCGGGGSGGVQRAGDTTNNQAGAGGDGTCFSGGSGGGGMCGSNTNSNLTPVPANGEDNGGGGGDGGPSGGFANGGGAGNPGGLGADYTTLKPIMDGGDGTGGLLILLVKGNLTLGPNAEIEAKGIKGGSPSLYVTGYACGGGGSGGGTIIIMYAGVLSQDPGATISVAGGAGGTTNSSGLSHKDGGNGGAGSIQGPTKVDV